MILLAHHIEVQHLPVVAVLFVAGGWIGWLRRWTAATGR